jgi:hypothetical protein
MPSSIEIVRLDHIDFAKLISDHRLAGNLVMIARRPSAAQR